MRRILPLLFVCLATLAAFGQADQAIVVSDSPDPVIPGNNLTYTIDVTNNGPNAAANGGANISLASSLVPVSVTKPAHFNCTALAQFMTCNTPSFAAGETAQIVLVVQVPPHLLNFPDGNFTSNFSTSGGGPDPVGGNNSVNVTTNYDSPQVDLSVAVADSPDPVTPNNDITYTVDVANAGPNTATNVNFNSFNTGSLRFQSVNEPLGWSCTEPAVGATPTFTCTTASFAPGTVQFTVVVRADSTVLGINDGTVQTNFSVNGTGNDTNNANNSETESTGYVTPDANITVAVTDSPDPVFPDGNITYTVTVGNSGPDAAPSVTLNSFGNNNLRFQSANVPAEWDCTLPAPNAQTAGFTCTLPAGLANGGSSVLSFVLQATDELIGINDTTIQFGFSANSSIADPVPGNNSETELTAYVTPDADMSVAVSDSPDPVNPDGNITYTVTVANGGPDAAPNVTLNSFGNNNLRFQSAGVPAEWDCTLPAPNAQTAGFTCTLPGGMASGGSSVLTFVLQATAELIGIADTTIQFGFSVNGGVADPDNTDNSETETTTYDAANANLAVTATDAPDPVAAGSNITYSGSVTSAGPDTATSVTLTIPLDPSSLFQSISGPAGFTCGGVAAGATGTITCTAPTLANGASLPFTLVVQVNPALLPGPDGTIAQQFLIGSATNDPVIPNNSVTVNTSYTTPDADLSVTNSDAPDPVSPGGTITYTQTLTNNGPDTAVNVTLTEVLPPSVGFTSITPPAGFTCGTTPAIGASGTITCTAASLANGAGGTFTIVVDVLAASGSIGNTVTVDSDTFDPDTLDNSATVSTTIVSTPVADLSLTNDPSTASAPAGSTFFYTLVITNNGPDAAPNVVLTDTLPSGLLFRSITEPTGFDCTTPAVGTSGTITCTAPTLANGASATFTLTVEVAPDANGPLVNDADVASDASDPNSGNSGDTAPGVVAGPASANLAIQKTLISPAAVIGSQVVFTITVTNNGPSTATNVTVNDTLPAQLDFVSAVPSQGTCNAASPVACTLGPIINGASATITLTARVIAPGTFTNTATVSATEGDPSTLDNSSTTPPITSLPAGDAAAVPTLSEWGLILFAALLGFAALMRMKM